jgi:hypothetical protein
MIKPLSLLILFISICLLPLVQAGHRRYHPDPPPLYDKVLTSDRTTEGAVESEREAARTSKLDKPKGHADTDAEKGKKGAICVEVVSESQTTNCKLLPTIVDDKLHSHNEHCGICFKIPLLDGIFSKITNDPRHPDD